MVFFLAALKKMRDTGVNGKVSGGGKQWPKKVMRLWVGCGFDERRGEREGFCGDVGG